MKIKVVYDWWGPKGPLINNYAPNILQLADATHRVKIDDWRNYVVPQVTTSIFSKMKGYEFAPTKILHYTDVFVYEYLYIWKQHLGTMCTPGHGMIEQSYMTPEVLSYIKNFHGYILIENTVEAFITGLDLKFIHDYFSYHQIPYRKVIYQTGCPNAEEWYKQWADHNNIPEDNRMNVIYFEWVEWNLSKSLITSTIPQLPKFENIKYDFISFNRRFRNHRTDLIQLFYKHNLLDKSLFSMPDVCPDNKTDRWIDRLRHQFTLKIGLTTDDLNNIQSKLPLKFDKITDEHLMVQDSNYVSQYFYNQCLVSIVTETNFDTEIISTTEKTFKPIKYKQPFIIVGAPKSLGYLKKWGYKTFSEFWDESYDDINNHDERLIRIGEICREISEWTHERKQDFFNRTREIVDHNYHVLLTRYPNNFNCQFWNQLYNRYAQNI